MSYCRFSSDDWRCDLYLYADVKGGYTLHIAHKRISGDVPRLDWDIEDQDRFWQSYHTQNAYVQQAIYDPILLPFAGEDLRLADLAEVEAWLLRLRELGYNFPDYVLEMVRQEREMEQAG